jgi:hypothetical protein
MATVATMTTIRLCWWPGGRVASHIYYLIGKIYASDYELHSIEGELSAADHGAIAWPPWPPRPPIFQMDDHLLTPQKDSIEHNALILLYYFVQRRAEGRFWKAISG